jgi:hypothetical protein
LCRDHASTLTALENTNERKIMSRFPLARTFTLDQNLLDCFKQFRGNNWHKASIKPLTMMTYETEIGTILSMRLMEALASGVPVPVVTP